MYPVALLIKSKGHSVPRSELGGDITPPVGGNAGNSPTIRFSMGVNNKSEAC